MIILCIRAPNQRCRLLFRTAFGTIPLVSPRLHRCACQPAGSKTFSPLTALFTEHTAPELLYLETRWASLVSYGLTVGLLKDVLPVDASSLSDLTPWGGPDRIKARFDRFSRIFPR